MNGYLLAYHAKKRGVLNGDWLSNHTWWDQYANGLNKIRRWHRRHQSWAAVKYLVLDDLRATRSPGKRCAYQRWLERHQDVLPVLIGQIDKSALIGVSKHGGTSKVQ